MTYFAIWCEFSGSEGLCGVGQEVTAEVQNKHYAGKKIATEIVPEQTWWNAEDYHQQCAPASCYFPYCKDAMLFLPLQHKQTC